MNPREKREGVQARLCLICEGGEGGTGWRKRMFFNRNEATVIWYLCTNSFHFACSIHLLT